MRIILLLFLATGLVACGQLKKTPSERQFKFSRAWARHTIGFDYTGFRINHRMQPLLFGDFVIQGNAIDGIQAYHRKTGHLQWRKDVKGGVEAGASLDGSSLYFGGNDGVFYSIDAYTGQTRWTFPLRAEGLGRPLVKDGVVYFVAGNNMAYALKASSGEQLWFYNRIDAANLTIRGSAEPSLAGENIIMGFSDGFVVALNRKTGGLRWERRISRQLRFKDVDSKPLVKDGRIYISSYDGEVFAMEATSGKVVWRSATGGFANLNLHKGVIYASTSDFRVVALDKASGKVLWVTNLEKTVAGSPQFYKGLVLFGEWSGDLKALEARTGRLVGSYSTGRGLTSDLQVDRDNDMLYGMGTDGDLYAFRMKWQKNSEKWEWEK